MRFLYINPDPATKDRATVLGCGWMPDVPAQFQSIAEAPCVILSGGGQTVVIPEPTTSEAVAAELQPILDAEAAAVDATRNGLENAETLARRAQQALTTHKAYLAQPAIPASPTNAQVIAALRVIRQQTDALTRQVNALIRLQLQQLDDVSDS